MEKAQKTFDQLLDKLKKKKGKVFLKVTLHETMKEVNFTDTCLVKREGDELFICPSVVPGDYKWHPFTREHFSRHLKDFDLKGTPQEVSTLSEVYTLCETGCY